MTTDKKPKPKERESKDDRVRQTPREGTEPEDLWARLRDLGSDFHHAATARRSEDLAKMAHVLRWLSEEPEFREAAHSSLRAYLTSKLGYRVTARREEERTLLAGVEAALITAPGFFDASYGNRPSSRSETEDHFLVKVVTRAILGLLPLCPQLYGQVESPALTADITGLPWDDGQEYQEIMTRVETAIAPEMFDPDSADPKALVRAAMRALGVDPDYVKNMYRN